MQCDTYTFGQLQTAHGKTEVKGKEYSCSSEGRPLDRWVELAQNGSWAELAERGLQVRGQLLLVLCVECYTKIFGQWPLPSTYEGNQYGKLVTPADEERRLNATAENYAVYY